MLSVYEVRAWLRLSRELETFCRLMAETEESAKIDSYQLYPVASYKNRGAKKNNVLNNCELHIGMTIHTSQSSAIVQQSQKNKLLPGAL